MENENSTSNLKFTSAVEPVKKRQGRPKGSKNGETSNNEEKPVVGAVKGSEKVSEQVLVDKDKLDAILAKQAKQDEMISILTDSVSRARLEQAQNKLKPKGTKRCFLKIWTDEDGKEHLITSWMSHRNNRLIYSKERPDIPIGEILLGKYFFSDGGDTDWVEQVLFTRLEKMAFAEVIKEKVDDDGNTWLTLRMEDPKWGVDTLQISPTFVNP